MHQLATTPQGRRVLWSSLSYPSQETVRLCISSAGRSTIQGNGFQDGFIIDTTRGNMLFEFRVVIWL